MDPSGEHRTKRDGGGKKPVGKYTPQVLTELILDQKKITEDVKSKMKGTFTKFQELVDASIEPSDKAKDGYKVTRNSAFDPAADFLSANGLGHVRTFSPLELIKELRHYLRENHKDLRLSSGCWNTAWDFIEIVLVQRRGGRGPFRMVKGTRNKDEDHADKPLSKDDIVGPTTSRQRTIAARNGYVLQSPSAPKSQGKPEKPRYFASSGPHGVDNIPRFPGLASSSQTVPVEQVAKRTHDLDLSDVEGISTRSKITRTK
jgi:hypothetical protein